MTYVNALEQFLTASICIVLLYNFLTTVLFCFQKELLFEKKKIQIGQKILLILTLIAFGIYLFTAKTIPTDLFILPWIWGFLASHLFIVRKNRWLNELLGLGMLLAITIILFFKQTEIIQTVFDVEMYRIKYEIVGAYVSLGFVLGALFWTKSA
ncbi:hypothetical protein IMCC3317_45170 [Kordia antarctica]|uniref:Uncharacterized protein n=1 Tax=Kordia antarctica TaxID=1218801 RepID=A0A7L4ZSZ0_9FLAO|nr:hypothetical protein [Kordia antarctica]QHI39116.1 hypothetical protein IMCC3317_45170 [Kordia antarctica]